MIRLDLLGDVLFSMPAVEGLRRKYPNAYIAMLTLPYTAPLARLYPSLNEVIPVDTNRIRSLSGIVNVFTWREYVRVFRTLRKRKFDIAVSLSGQMASFWAFLSAACLRIGYGGEAYPFMLTHPVAGKRYQERMHEVEYVRHLAEAAGADDVPRRLQVPVSSRAESRVDEMLKEEGIDVGDRLVLIHAGATNGSAKRWPPRYWGSFAELLERDAGAKVLLIGAKGDEPVARMALGDAPSTTRSMVGRTNVEDLLALIARADLVATGDSGPLHLSVALGRPLVAPYGPTDPQVHGPYHPTAPAVIHRHDLACSPCYSMAATADCPLGDPICMRLVTVEQMAATALVLLNETSD